MDLKAAFNKIKNLFTIKLNLNLRKKLVKYYIWCWILDTSEYRTEIPGKFWNVLLLKDGDQLNRLCSSKEVLHRVKKERNILHTIKRKKANWIGHILSRKCLRKHVIEGKIEWRIEVTGRRGRKCKQLLDDLKETRGYWKLKRKH
jgi:hypothetical protein